jgi:hypothetical protein
VCPIQFHFPFFYLNFYWFLLGDSPQVFICNLIDGHCLIFKYSYAFQLQTFLLDLPLTSEKVNTFLPQCSGIWQGNLQVLKTWYVWWFLWRFNSFVKQKA